MKRVRTLLATSLMAIASCRGESVYRELAEPLVVDDYLALPTQATSDNASLVIRRSLQAHRRSISTPDEQYGYAFRPDSFVQLFHAYPSDRADERGMRTYVAYKSISSIRVDPYFDLSFLKDRFRLIIEGRFRRWESHIRTFLPQPDLGAEPETHTITSLILIFDDPTVAQRLSQALTLLSSPERR